MSKTFPSVSDETKKEMKKQDVSKTKRKVFYGLTPVDPYGCSCQKLIKKMYKSVAEGKKPCRVDCDRDKRGMNQYKIVCANCKEAVGIVYATDITLSDYCDLHYSCETDGDNWFGAMAMQLSPIDGAIGIECACGQDTRDFRANTTLSTEDMDKLQKEADKGKVFGKKDSKFYIERIK
jgi:hypothetical protein